MFAILTGSDLPSCTAAENPKLPIQLNFRVASWFFGLGSAMRKEIKLYTESCLHGAQGVSSRIVSTKPSIFHLPVPLFIQMESSKVSARIRDETAA